jgi:hypothetical protein
MNPAGLGIAGFGGGACQMAMCSIPEYITSPYLNKIVLIVLD